MFLCVAVEKGTRKPNKELVQTAVCSMLWLSSAEMDKFWSFCMCTSDNHSVRRASCKGARKGPTATPLYKSEWRSIPEILSEFSQRNFPATIFSALFLQGFRPHEEIHAQHFRHSSFCFDFLEPKHSSRGSSAYWGDQEFRDGKQVSQWVTTRLHALLKG